MICPSCGYDNLPGSDECAACQIDLAPLDLPTAHDRVESSLMKDRVERLQPVMPPTLRRDVRLGQALETLIEREVEALLVTEPDGTLVGILTERDLLKKYAGLDPALIHEPVERFMTANPETISPDDTVAFALHKMDVGGYRHLPVVKDRHAVGMVSAHDVIRHITKMCKER